MDSGLDFEIWFLRRCCAGLVNYRMIIRRASQDEVRQANDLRRAEEDARRQVIEQRRQEPLEHRPGTGEAESDRGRDGRHLNRQAQGNRQGPVQIVEPGHHGQRNRAGKNRDRKHGRQR